MDNTAARRECFADGRLLIKVRKGDKKDGDRFNVMEKEWQPSVISRAGRNVGGPSRSLRRDQRQPTTGNRTWSVRVIAIERTAAALSAGASRGRRRDGGERVLQGCEKKDALVAALFILTWSSGRIKPS